MRREYVPRCGIGELGNWRLLRLPGILKYRMDTVLMFGVWMSVVTCES